MKREGQSEGPASRRLPARPQREDLTCEELTELVRELTVRQAELETRLAALAETRDAAGSARDRLAELFELAPVAFLLLDETARVRAANLAAERLLGRPGSELVGVPLGRLASPSSLSACRLATAAIESGQPTRGLELAVERDEGSAVRVRLVGQLAHAGASVPALAEDRGRGLARPGSSARERRARNALEGNGPAYLLALLDVTEQQAAEERARRAEKLVFLGRVGSSLAHELRGPLGNVLAAVGLVRRLAGAPDPRLTEALDIAESELLASSRIVDRVLDLARGPSGPCGFVHLGPLVREAVARIPVPDQVTVQLELEPGLAPAYGEAGPLGQVLRNLCTNAVQAMPAGGLLSLSSRPGPPGFVEVVVADTGKGIPPGQLEAIFEPLHTTKPSGIGLGLTVSKGIVEEHGGAIEVESQPGRGSTFTVRLPTSCERRPLSSCAPSRAPVGA